MFTRDCKELHPLAADSPTSSPLSLLHPFLPFKFLLLLLPFIPPDMVPSLGLSKPRDIELTYFDFGGPAEKIRLTLLMGGVPFKVGRHLDKEGRASLLALRFHTQASVLQSSMRVSSFVKLFFLFLLNMLTYESYVYFGAYNSLGNASKGRARVRVHIATPTVDHITSYRMILYRTGIDKRW